MAYNDTGSATVPNLGSTKREAMDSQDGAPTQYRPVLGWSHRRQARLLKPAVADKGLMWRANGGGTGEGRWLEAQSPGGDVPFVEYMAVSWGRWTALC